MAKAKPVEADPVAEYVTEMVIYLPGPMDPSTTKWCGHTFQANVAKEIIGHAEGTDREKLNFHLIERARDNKHFVVGDGKPKRDAMAPPKTAEEYRAYVVGWLKDGTIQRTNDLIARFAKDRELRTACEVGSDDYAFISTLLMPKLHELAKADELSEGQVAAMWVNHGFNELPW